MRGSFAGLLAALVALAAGGVRAETELVVAAYPPLDESVKLAIPRFERLHPGVRVKLQVLAFGDHHNAMITALASGGSVPDVTGVDVNFIDRFAVDGGLEDLGVPPYGGKPLLARLVPFTRSQGYSRDGALVAIPTDASPGTLFYRKDLLDKAGVTEEDLTRSWDSFIAAGKKVKAATGAYLIPNAQDVADVYARQVKDGQPVFVSGQGGPLFKSTRFGEAFALARRVREAGIDARVGAWSNEWADGLRRGKIAAVISGAWLANRLPEPWLAPETQGLWRAAQLPGNAFASFGGSFHAIPRRAAHKREAWAFIRYLCFDRAQQVAAWRAAGAWPALRAALGDGFASEPVPFLGGQQARRLWRIAAERIAAGTETGCDARMRDAYATELEQVLEKGKSIEQAVDDAAAQGPWASHLPSVRRSCRPRSARDASTVNRRSSQ